MRCFRNAKLKCLMKWFIIILNLLGLVAINFVKVLAIKGISLGFHLVHDKIKSLGKLSR